MDFRHICTAAMVAKHDLQTAHEALEAGPETQNLRIVFMRHIILEIANIADLTTISKGLFKDHRKLGELHKPLSKSLEFFKYIRNVYVGHLVPDLTDKTFEWMPQANMVIGGTEPDGGITISWFALETAINTYADDDGHKIFESDTDLNYPPDLERFLNFLGETALRSLAYVTQLIEASGDSFDVPDIKADMIELAMKAGDTDFKFLRKGKR
ncbi:MAG: hypothetical protein GW808_02040 [Sphingomonadales bacterium]|nr:hypothetical protein [Sphingomonadales bacterium]NCO47928.1 hypothetical protein [Sphingomonadales bacterium]NCO99187.1 hypothetical protein [Sphingomonadales bacterium]NCP27592.1 hypothetical protein [Sphingomonadales bacterium]NCP42250.1 hypothetical protein [Sphingomonadales bacterium]